MPADIHASCTLANGEATRTFYATLYMLTYLFAICFLDAVQPLVPGLPFIPHSQWILKRFTLLGPTEKIV